MDEAFCPVCDEINEPIGFLGSRVHYRCRACGINYSHPKREDTKKPLYHKSPA